MKLYKQLKIWNRQRKAWMKVCHAAMDLFPEAFYGVNGKAKNSVTAIITLLRELRDRRAHAADAKMRSDLAGRVSVEIKRMRAGSTTAPVVTDLGPDYGPPPGTRSDAQRVIDHLGKGLGGSVFEGRSAKHSHQFLEGGANPICDICKKTYVELNAKW